MSTNYHFGAKHIFTTRSAEGEVELTAGLGENLFLSGKQYADITGPLDAFNRLRVSNPYTLFDSKQITDNSFWKMDSVLSGTGAVDYEKGLPHTIMKVTGAGKVIRQQHGYSSYQPGKSLLILMTGSLHQTSDSTVKSRIGYYDDGNDKNATYDDILNGDGFFFQKEGSSVSICYRTSNKLSGTPGVLDQIDTFIQQADWNIDTLDGNGITKINIDFTKRQIFYIEMEWLGVGDVTLGVFFRTQPIPCHRFNFTNGEYGNNTTIAYTTRASLPVRYELISTGGTDLMYQVCSSVISEGGFLPAGNSYHTKNDADVIAVSNESIVAALRHNQSVGAPKQPRVKLLFESLNLLVGSNADIIYTIYYFKSPSSDPTTGGTWINASSGNIDSSTAEYNISFANNTALPSLSGYDVKIVKQGMFTKELGRIDLSLIQPIILNSDVEGKGDYLVITCRNIAGTNANIYATLGWQEID